MGCVGGGGWAVPLSPGALALAGGCAALPRPQWWGFARPSRASTMVSRSLLAPSFTPTKVFLRMN